MPFSFELDDSQGYLRARLSGVATMEDVKSVLDAMSANEGYRNNRRLWDVRDCHLDMSSDELREFAELGKSRDIEPGKGAILASTDLTYGLTRVHQAFRESESFNVRVFRDEDECLRWLTT